MSWKLVAAGSEMFDQINQRWPQRDKASDGTIGDAAHQQRPSDHNPDDRGWVHAIDIDKDLRGSKNDVSWLADQMIAYARTRKPGWKRLKNIVWNDKVASGTYADTFWVWRGSGYDHFDHIHVSFTEQAEDNGNPFDLPIFSGKRGVWDGVVPYYDVLHKSMTENLRNKATWRLACRLKELGFYSGQVLPEGQQAFPTHAVKNMQEWMGWQIADYNVKTHKSIWRELDTTP